MKRVNGSFDGMVRWGLFLLIGFLSARGLAETASVSIQVDRPGTTISSNLFGIFFEEINFAGDGGIYAEMVRNRSFQESSSPDFWTVTTDGTASGSISVDSAQPLNSSITRSLMLTMDSGSGSVGAANSGYWGMSIVSNAVYNLNLFAKDGGSFSGLISARLESIDGSAVYAQTTLGSPGADWQKMTASLIPDGTDHAARLVVSIDQVGSVRLSMVSLFPDETYAGRDNGLRLDLANKLEDMSPAFLRFPGGNFIESNTITNAVRWKESIGPIEERPGHQNDAWGYWSTDGLGAHEFFLWCEDMGMEPMYDVYAGLSLGYANSSDRVVPLDELGPYVQDALDIIEYANGDTNTTWGAVRAANGHPEPFNMKYLEIGNENGGALYDERYAVFYDAVKAEYPAINLIASGGNWDGGPPWSSPVEIVDEHYYYSPTEMISFFDKYDSYDRNGYKVFVGEYATKIWGDSSRDGSLEFALAEAVFMAGMERNSDVVVLAAYAPMFANASTALPTEVPPHGAVGVGSWLTAVEYDDVVVSNSSTTLYSTDFSGGAGEWDVYSGSWSAAGGSYLQTDAAATDCRSTVGDTNWSNYTLSLRARKTSGDEGFLILFNWQDDDNWTWLNLGGWGNTQHAIERSVGGSKMTLATVSGSLVTGQWYDIEITVSGYDVTCTLDGAEIFTVNYNDTGEGIQWDPDLIYYDNHRTYGTPSYYVQKMFSSNPGDYTLPTAVDSGTSAGLYASTSFDEAAGEMVVKVVNPYDVDVDTSFDLAGAGAVEPDATVLLLTSEDALDENSLVNPTFVSTVTNSIFNADTNFVLTLPANSFSVLRLTPSGIDTISDLLFEVPSMVTNGDQTATTLWGYQSGGWISLDDNSSYAIAYTSQNPDIAVVDSSGTVTGISSGTTQIIATYGALGLSATQSVHVVSSPVTLMHRYSFGEASGTTVTDSVGGVSWNGILPNGGTLGGGELILSASSSQYVDLPSGILGDSDAVTIEAWASFPSPLPTHCFFFGFGNTSGDLGYDYIFCQPLEGRIAITDDTFGSEENAYGNSDFSLKSNLHITAVFNPPGGYLAIYTNGVLAGINSGITIPLSAVTDTYGYIGRSLYPADSYFDFNLDEFRIYDGALSPAEIAATQELGPDALLSADSPALQTSVSGEDMLIGWPASSAGYVVQSRTNLVDGEWIDDPSATPQLDNGQWRVTVPVTNDVRFYQLRR